MPDVTFSCCFCGDARESDEPITVSASWVDEEGNEQWQAWGAHRACLVERFSDVARFFGGPIFGPGEEWPPDKPPPFG